MTSKLFAAAVGIAMSAQAALAADGWPDKAITMIVPYNPGGTTDLLARMAADAISAEVGQPVVVENKPGAGGVVGATIAAQAKSDGYTIFFGNNATNVVQPLINKAVQYDPVESFDGIATTANAATFIGVNAGLGIDDLDGFVTYLKDHANTKYGTAGVGSMGQFTAEYFMMETGTDATHIPYQGSNNAMAAVLSNEVQFMIDPVVLTQAGSDKIKILAAMIPERHPNLPDVPTTSELGYDLTLSGWFGVFAPEGTDPDAIARMSGALEGMVASEVYQEQTLKMGLLPEYRDAAATDAVVAADLETFAAIRDASGISID